MPVGTVKEAEHHVIGYKDGVFEPATLEVAVGDHVMFINESEDYVWPASNIHPTHEIYPGFDPELGLEPGQSWSFEFLNPGEWRFHNHLQPQEGGTINVTGEPVRPAEAVALTETADPETLSFKTLEPMTPEQARPLFDDDRALTQAVYDSWPGAGGLRAVAQRRRARQGLPPAGPFPGPRRLCPVRGDRLFHRRPRVPVGQLPRRHGGDVQGARHQRRGGRRQADLRFDERTTSSVTSACTASATA